MFGLDRNNALKLNIIESLENAGQVVSASTLHTMLNFSNLTILTTARDLQNDLKSIYPNGEVRLIIDKMGLLLERHGSSLQYFFAKVFSADSSYTIIRDLFLRRKILTEELSALHGLSPSTLRRKTADINTIFVDYDLHISVAKYTTISGNEKDIRFMFFTFLSAIHKQFSRIPWIEDKEHYIKRAHDILEYLSLPSYSYNSDFTAFWVYIQEVTGELTNGEALDPEQFAFLDPFQLPEKPEFLEEWDEISWQFFFIGLYTSGKYDITIRYPEIFETQYYSIAQQWISTFETVFPSLTRRGKKRATQKIYQQILNSHFFTINGDLTTMTRTFSYDTFVDAQPNYANYFATFWDKFTESTDYKPITSPFYRSMSVLLALTICPLNDILPEIDIYFLSNQNHLTENYLKQQFSQLLGNTFNIVFSSNPMNADIILSPSPTPRDFRNYNKEAMLIRVPFMKSDIDEFVAVANRLIGTTED